MIQDQINIELKYLKQKLAVFKEIAKFIDKIPHNEDVGMILEFERLQYKIKIASVEHDINEYLKIKLGGAK